MNTGVKAAKTLCEISDWSLTNLQIQKILYIANRVYFGRHDTPLINEDFEAWDYGPVLPDVYKEFKMYGNKPVRAGFLLVPSYEQDSAERALLEEAYAVLKHKTGGELVSMTHLDGGAWASVYKPGARSIIIPKDRIRKEYDYVVKKSTKKR